MGKKATPRTKAPDGPKGADGWMGRIYRFAEKFEKTANAAAAPLPSPRIRLWLAGFFHPEETYEKVEKDACIEKLGFPVIVKPAQEGSSIGMSKANSRDELHKALHDALAYNCDVYAERWVTGKEYTVALLNGEALPVIRLETPNAFYDYEAKYNATTTQYHCPSGLNEEQEAFLRALAVKASKVLGVEGWARLDVFIDDAGQYQLIEINTVPGMTDHSLVPMAAKQAGIEFDDLVLRVLETSLG